jgi:pimeloyl-ACP methyl ester carboxylesterase
MTRAVPAGLLNQAENGHAREAELASDGRFRERNMRRIGRRRILLLLAAMMAPLAGASPLLWSAPGVAAESSSGQYADLPGVKLWFTDTGGSGVPVVLLHANTGTSATWQPQVEAFARAGYRVIAFDRRGWGKSAADPATGAQPGSVAGDLDALADHLKLDKFHLVGVAGGGFVSLDYAAWRPERLRSLVVAASTGQFAEKEMRGITARVEIPELRKQAAVYREVGPSYRAANPDGTKRWIEIEEHAQQPGAPSQPLRAPNTFAKLASVTMPVLVLAADADLLAPPALMRAWAAHLTRHEFAAVPDSGHAIAWEHPDVFNEKVLAFIKQR